MPDPVKARGQASMVRVPSQGSCANQGQVVQALETSTCTRKVKKWKQSVALDRLMRPSGADCERSGE